MDYNIVVLSGRLAAVPEVRTFDSGGTLMRYLVTVRTTEPRRRVDVIPVTWWEPPPSHLDAPWERGSEVWVTGTVQRRFWSATGNRASRIEIVAYEVQLKKDLDSWEVDDTTVA